MLKRFLLTLSSCILGAAYSAAQTSYDPSVFIKAEINSGNPNVPFPQFKKYKYGKSLADNNAEGVTHADMEKAMREAYLMMTHRCRYDSTTVGGVRYITYNSSEVPGNFGIRCTEGDGYALLASAIFADQPTFNGLYMWIHDNRFRNVKRFKDGKVLDTKSSGKYLTPYLAGWTNTENSEEGEASATDGDEDIAMALLIANKQWGDLMMNNGEVVKDADGEPISLYNEASNVIAALVDTTSEKSTLGDLHNIHSGDIGLDGYVKGGDGFGEMTNWAISSGSKLGIDFTNKYFYILGGNASYSDYNAPAYYDEFYRWFADGEGKKSARNSEWVRSQFRRAKASSNWINSQAYDQGLYPSIGRHYFDEDNKLTFTNYTSGEDFRYPWRNMLDYIWHGNAEYDWNPETHEVINGNDSSQYNMALRYAEILKYPLDKDGGVLCTKLGLSPDPAQPKWQGIAQNGQCYNMYGKPLDLPNYYSNYAIGAGAGAAVISEDHDLIADIYRQCELIWDDANFDISSEEERYEGSTPKYFHDWFRLLGMLTCSGNLIAPSDMGKDSNVKVYLSTNKTFAYVGDTITYTVSVRNYGAGDAENVIVKTVIDNNMKFINTSNKNSDFASNMLTWNIKSLPGFKSGKTEESMDTLTFKVVVTDTLNKHIALKSTAFVGDEEVWTSNEFPNNATYTMERNIVDVLESPLQVKKSVLAVDGNERNKVIEVSIQNNSNTEWLDGGRDNVRLSYGECSLLSHYQKYKYFRFWNDAQESYINLSNYRVSYYFNDSLIANNLTVQLDNGNDLEKYGWIKDRNEKTDYSIEHLDNENNRVIIKFQDVLSCPTTHLLSGLNSEYMIHKGGFGPLFIRIRFENSNYTPLINFSTENDWSYSPQAEINRIDGQIDTYTLVSPCWADLNNKGYMVDNYSRNTCDDSPENYVENILVEEFDGYTWRRILGNAPVNGKKLNQVVYSDTIPSNLKFEGFVGNHDGIEFLANKDEKNGGVVVWTCDSMGIGTNKVIKYQVSAAEDGKISADIKSNLSASNIPDQQYKVNVEIDGVISGIESVNTNDTLVDVVGANGVVLRKNVEKKSALKGLPIGVYVVGTEKIAKISAE